MSDIFSTKHVNDAMNSSVADARPIAKTEDLQKAIPTSDTLRYVKNDTFVADVSALLGLVYYERIGSEALRPFYINVSVDVDPNSKLTTPQMVSELIIDSKGKLAVEALSLISTSVAAEEMLEVRIINNSAARIVQQGDAWEAAVNKWLNNPLCHSLVNDPKVGTISVVTGAIQKYFITKKYKKFEAGVKGGGWGVNVDGSLYTSTSQFELSVIYGLDLVTFKQVDSVHLFNENIVKQVVVSDTESLQSVNRMFDNMAKLRPSLFESSFQSVIFK
jgi:hypothetical protein